MIFNHFIYLINMSCSISFCASIYRTRALNIGHWIAPSWDQVLKSKFVVDSIVVKRECVPLAAFHFRFFVLPR